MDFYLQLALLMAAAVFLMMLLPIMDTLRDETWKREDLWKVLEVTGLWLAAGVGLFAIIVSSHDAHEQLVTLVEQAKNTSEQVKEARNQRVLLVEQTRAHLRREAPQISVLMEQQPDGSQKAAAWSVSPRWVNTGSTSAKEVQTWWGWAVAQAPFDPSTISSVECPRLRAPDKLRTSVVAPGGGMTLLANQIPVPLLLAAQQRNATIFLLGHMEYRDVYPETPLHREDWCVILFPNDIDRGIGSPINVQSEVVD